MNVDNQIDLPLGLSGSLAAPIDSGKNIFFVIALPEGRSPQTGKPILPVAGMAKADAAAPNTPILIAGLFHQIEERREVGGAFGKGTVNGQPQPVLMIERTLAALEPFAIILEFSLASGLGVFHNRQPIFQTQAVR